MTFIIIATIYCSWLFNSVLSENLTISNNYKLTSGSVNLTYTSTQHQPVSSLVQCCRDCLLHSTCIAAVPGSVPDEENILEGQVKVTTLTFDQSVKDIWDGSIPQKSRPFYNHCLVSRMYCLIRNDLALLYVGQGRDLEKVTTRSKVKVTTLKGHDLELLMWKSQDERSFPYMEVR